MKRKGRTGRFEHEPLQLPDEQWKPVVGFPKYYVSNLGRIKTTTSFDKIMSPSKTGNIVLRKNRESHSFKIAQLILRAFVGPPGPNQWLARHLDDDRSNNKLNNLAWGNQKDNYQDGINNGTQGHGSPGAIKRGLALKGKPRPESVKRKISETKNLFPERQYFDNPKHPRTGRFIGKKSKPPEKDKFYEGRQK